MPERPLTKLGRRFIRLDAWIMRQRQNFVRGISYDLGLRALVQTLEDMNDNLRGISRNVSMVGYRPSERGDKNAPGVDPLHKGDIPPMVRIVGEEEKEQWISTDSIHVIEHIYNEKNERWEWGAYVGDNHNLWLALSDNEAHLLTKVMHQVRDIYRVFPNEGEED